MLNGICSVTAAEGLSVRDALLKSNRFRDIEFSKSRLEYHFIKPDNHESDTRYVNWDDSSLTYVNCSLVFHTEDNKEWGRFDT